MRFEQVLEKYRNTADSADGEFLFDQDVAKRLVTDCTAARVVVVGIEAFAKEGGAVRPLLDQIADFSRLVDSGCDDDCMHKCNRSALAFLDQLPADQRVHVTFVLQDV